MASVIIVRKIGSEWSYKINFAEVSLEGFTVRNLKEKLYQVNNNATNEQIHLVYMGVVLTEDDIEIKNMVMKNN